MKKVLDFLLAPPREVHVSFSDFPGGYIRISRVWRIVFIGTLLVHIVFLFVFLRLGIREMVYYNLLSVTIFAGGLFLLRAGMFHTGGSLAMFELVLHASLSVYFTGWQPGFQYYILIIPLAMFINPLVKHYREVVFKVFWIATSVAAFVLLRQMSFYRDPVYTLTGTEILLTHHFTFAGFLICMILTAAYFSVFVRRSETALAAAHERSERLLHNILPPEIAKRLEEGEQTIADRFDEASVLFLDIVDFTELASRLPPSEIVTLLNEIFSIFDQLSDDYGLEKIKTIGDAYMAVAGIPVPAVDHATRAVEMAIAMLESLRSFSSKMCEPIQARVGICSGPVVAGVIGRRKFIYDLWGDTVNTASRMESHGRPDRIQVTNTTYEILKDYYHFEYRGIVDIKGKGAMPTYFLDLTSSGERNSLI